MNVFCTAATVMGPRLPRMHHPHEVGGLADFAGMGQKTAAI